jgi:hypothetical protein
MKTLNILLGACLAVSASQVLAQSALNDANRIAMTTVIEAGKKCVDGLLPQKTALFANPSADMKALLLTPISNLANSAELRKLNDQQRIVVADMSNTAMACRAHQVNIQVLFTDLAAKEDALKNDNEAKTQLARVGEASAMVNQILEATAKSLPDLAHFLSAHSQGK